MEEASVNASTFKAFEHAGWEKVASLYHDYFSSLTSQIISPLLEAVNVRAGMRLLDVATGPGHVAANAAGYGAKVVGLDFSGAMVAEARRRYPTLEFREGDAEALPFPDHSFDGVAINFGVLHFSHPEQALAEAYRVLSPGGRIGFTVWAKPDTAVGFGIVLNAIQTYGNTNIPLPSGPPFFRFSDPEECERTLLEAGFVSPTIIQISQLWSLPSPDILFEALFEGSVRTGPLLRSQSGEVLNVIRTTIREQANKYNKDGSIEIPMPAMLASAIKS